MDRSLLLITKVGCNADACDVDKTFACRCRTATRQGATLILIAVAACNHLDLQFDRNLQAWQHRWDERKPKPPYDRKAPDRTTQSAKLSANWNNRLTCVPCKVSILPVDAR
mmetsp:Transcript_7883/g.17633  ORF Transcript_7883/g.17633 Transcript_7883/m.17633 type:complete len:111 (-) Transcript_7883:135-467(-)